jgi:hypothetical protein
VQKCGAADHQSTQETYAEEARVCHGKRPVISTNAVQLELDGVAVGVPPNAREPCLAPTEAAPQHDKRMAMESQHSAAQKEQQSIAPHSESTAENNRAQ